MINQTDEIIATPYWSTRKTQVRCVNVINETHDVKTFQLVAVPKQQFVFKPGQFISLEVVIDGERHLRSYTIASTPTRPHLLELTIKREAGGTVSPWLHQNIKQGSEFEIRGPAGRFNCLDIASDKVLLIAAGSGITPIMSMARFWADQAMPKDVRLLNWVRGVEDIIFRHELSLLDFRFSQLNVDVICTRPGLKENWLGRRGRINPTTLKDMVPDLSERTVFCCGPDGFMQSVQDCLAANQFDLANYHDESFDPGGKKKNKQVTHDKSSTEQDGDSTAEIFQITLTKSGRQIEITEDEYLLEKLEAEGVSIESACRQGNCGSCVVTKSAGQTHTENEAGLTDEMRDDNKILTCTTRVKSDISLDL